MANIARAPFWVPRPADQYEWNPFTQPVHNRTLALTLAEAQFFGAHGQAPTKKWAPYQLYDDQSSWAPIPANLDIPFPIFKTLTAPPPYILTPGATLNWNFLVDDPAPFYRHPAPRHLLVGLALPSSTRTFASYDDTAPWQRTITAPQQQPVQQAPFKTPNWSSYDETVPLAGSRASPITLTAAPVRPLRWNVAFDDPASWAPRAGYSIALSATPVPAVRNWNSNDETAPWQRTIVPPQQPVQQAPAKIPNFTSYDETAPWLASPGRSIGLTTTQVQFYGQHGQAYPFRWNATLDDASTRLIPSSAPNNGLFATLVPPPPFANARPFWRSLDDPPVWQRTAPNSQPIGLTSLQAQFYGQPGQGYPFRWNATQDDPPAWLPRLAYSIALQGTLAAPVPFKIPNFTSSDETAPWFAAPRARNALVQPQSFIHPPPSFYSEDAFWQGAPRAWNVLIAPAPLVHPLPAFYSEDAFWQGAPRATQSVQPTIPPPLPPFRPNFTQDDASFWAWLTPNSQSIRLTTTQQQLYGGPGEVTPRFWAFNYQDSTTVWWRFFVPASSNYIVIAPPLPPANVAYSIVTVKATLSRSVVTARTSISVATFLGDQVASTSTTSVAVAIGAGSRSTVGSQAPVVTAMRTSSSSAATSRRSISTVTYLGSQSRGTSIASKSTIGNEGSESEVD